MTIKDIKSAKAILDAIAEFDVLGRDQFLKKYGFKPSRSYLLLSGGKRYDSKAIIGVARGYARPDLGPMTPDEFSGGEATVRRKLEELGFAVEVAKEKPNQNAKSFLLTWKESGWPYSNIVRMRKAFEKQGYVEETWRLRASRQAKPGDRVWLLKQGSGLKGIFGIGHLVGKPRPGETSEGKTQMVAPIRFSQFTDPKTSMLIDEKTIRTILAPSQMNAQASGDPLKREQTIALQQLFPTGSHLTSTIKAEEGAEDLFEPQNVTDARERISRTIAARRGQKAFRDSLIAAYVGKCAITRCGVLDVLEAAHIYPYRGPDTNKTSNGILLRADLHTLFDCNLIAIDPVTLTVIVAPQLLSSPYKVLHGRKLRVPATKSQAPSKEAVLLHRTASGL